jgi:hypothetical protein
VNGLGQPDNNPSSTPSPQQVIEAERAKLSELQIQIQEVTDMMEDIRDENSNHLNTSPAQQSATSSGETTACMKTDIINAIKEGQAEQTQSILSALGETKAEVTDVKITTMRVEQILSCPGPNCSRLEQEDQVSNRD